LCFLNGSAANEVRRKESGTKSHNPDMLAEFPGILDERLGWSTFLVAAACPRVSSRRGLPMQMGGIGCDMQLQGRP
jgi:hypothetical protein